MIGELPRSLTVNGRREPIRTDYRDALRIMTAFNDPELEDKEKVYVCIAILYKNFGRMKPTDYSEAFKAALEFLDGGQSRTGREKKPSPRIMDWEQDEAILFPAVNKAAGCEVRTLKYLHWWTFLGYLHEVSEGVYSTVLSLRLKKAKGKKLEKYEREWWAANKDICVLREKLTAEDQANKDRLEAMLG